MRVVARPVDLNTCPVELRTYLGQSFITVGKEYVVHALTLFESHLFVQVVDDLEHPSWRPFWLFYLVDSSMPEDWICGVFHDEPQLVIGPEFVAKDHAAYSAMVELDIVQVNRFWARIKGGASGA